MNTGNYYYQIGETKHFSNKLPTGAYIASGGREEIPAGTVFLMVWDNGTCLTPVFNSDGSHVVKTGNFGKILHSSGEWINE